MLPETLQHGFGDLAGERVVFGQLQVVFRLGRLVAGRYPTVLPGSLFQRDADTGGFFAGKHIGNAYQHGTPAEGKD